MSCHVMRYNLRLTEDLRLKDDSWLSLGSTEEGRCDALRVS